MDRVTIIRSAKRSTIGIKIEPDGSITVTAPYLIPRFVINTLLKEKTDWIAQKQQLLLVRKPTDRETGYLYLGKRYEVKLRQNKRTVVELEDKFYIAATNEKYVKNYVTNWYKQQARKVIVERVRLYAKRLDLTYKSVSLMEATTRWGSCSSQKNLNFNWKLIMAPLPVLDYVVTHELAHLVELNHSRAFWETVRKMFPIYREYRTWLKRYGHTLRV